MYLYQITNTINGKIYIGQTNNIQKMGKQGERNGRAKLSADDVRKIRELSANKVPNSEIYKRYPNVSTSTILNVINKKTWKNLL